MNDSQHLSGNTDSDTPSNLWPALIRDLLLYSLMRILLVTAIAALLIGVGKALGFDFPFVVAVLLGIVIGLPISMRIGAGLRRRVNSSISAIDARRRESKAKLREQLR